MSKGNPTLVQEIEKLEIQIAHAKKYHLVYSQYKYLLDFKQISFDPLTLMATVSLIEGHDVVFDISNKISPTSPITSSMRNLQHTIILQKESDEWKIKSDQYDDYLWRFLRTTGTNAKELQRLTDDERDLTDVPGDLNISATCSLPGDITSYSYDRYGAVAYAKVWATAPRPYNHPPFDDYTDFGGDCTNFVSQVIHIGGKANMFNPGNFGVGQPGWYYYSVQDRATAWNDVKALHDFITDYSVWLGGPEGCDVQQYEVLEGDIIQYNWTNDDYWDHSVLINRSEDYGTNNRYHWVAGHTPDTYNYPFTNYALQFPNVAYRFIHIQRIDGYVYNFIPLVKKDFFDGAGDYLKSNLSPYPSPDNSASDQLSPYPSP